MLDISAIKNRVRMVLAKQQQASNASLYWHGTSDKFIQSILANGLDPSSAKEGTFTRKGTLYPQFFSVQSLGGIYFAKNLALAIESGNTMIKKNRTKLLLVGAVLQTREALPDEDDYQDKISGIIRDVTNQFHIPTLIDLYVRNRLQSSDSFYKDSIRTKVIADFRNDVLREFKIDLTKRKDTADLLDLINAILIAFCTRFLAIKKEQEQNSNYYDLIKSIVSHFHRIAPNKVSQHYTVRNPLTKEEIQTIPRGLHLPSASVADDKVRSLLRTFILTTRNNLQNIMKNNGSRHTLRVTKPVKFRGRSRIVCMFEILDFIVSKKITIDSPNPTVTRIKIHYGYPPVGFFAEYEKISKADNIEWYDKQGLLIGTGKNIKFTNYASDPYSPMGVEVNDNPSGSDFVNYDDPSLDAIIKALTPEEKPKKKSKVKDQADPKEEDAPEEEPEEESTEDVKEEPEEDAPEDEEEPELELTASKRR